jgi:glycerol-3-phosphate acyltransferase PlsX
MTKIAVDCMGGDYAPEEIVKGCILAYKELGLGTYLVGDRKAIESVLRKEGVKESEALTIVHSEEKVEMHEPPSVVLKKKNSSLYVAGMLVREGEGGRFCFCGQHGCGANGG